MEKKILKILKIIHEDRGIIQADTAGLISENDLAVKLSKKRKDISPELRYLEGKKYIERPGNNMVRITSDGIDSIAPWWVKHEGIVVGAIIGAGSTIIGTIIGALIAISTSK